MMLMILFLSIERKENSANACNTVDKTCFVMKLRCRELD
jgi:hypothetical protein